MVIKLLTQQEAVYTFEDLEAWKVAREYRLKLVPIIRKFPADERFKLTDQLTRSSRSITNNIAEGFGRLHHQENIQFCRQARGSLFETLDHFIIALDEKYIDKKEFDEARFEYEKCLKILNGYIAYLKRAKQSVSATKSQ